LCEVQGWTIAGDYTDGNRSASNGKKRERWNDLLADIEAGKIDAIAAWDQDRNWRVMHELEELRRFFATLGRPIKLATTGQGEIDLFSPTGVLMAQIKTAVSEHEIAMMRVRQLRAARQRAREGKPKWKRAYGYVPDTRDKKQDDGTRRIDRQAQRRVKAAYEAVVATKPDRRKTITAIAEEWNQAQAYGLNGTPWSPSTMSLFLRSPRNAGLRDHLGEIVRDDEGQRVKGTWPPLVDEKLWDAAQLVLAGNVHGPKSVRKHLLTGVLRCGNPLNPRTGEPCTGRLGANWQKQKTGGQPGRLKAGQLRSAGGVVHRLVYRCPTCRGVTIRAEHIEPLLYEIVAGRLVMPDAEDLLKAEIRDAERAGVVQAELDLLYAERRNIGVERGQLLLTGEQAKIATDLINAKITALEAERQDQRRLQVFEGIPLGRPQAAAAIKELSPDRYRAVLDLLLVATVAPVGKGGHAFDPERVTMEWM
jgi:DNA invertase Pin-like site-specific DNA recombinase